MTNEKQGGNNGEIFIVGQGIRRCFKKNAHFYQQVRKPRTIILKKDMIMKESKNQMKMTDNRPFPRWVFAILAMGSFWASGVYMGIQSVEGVALADLLRVIGFGIVGLLTAWGAIAKQ